MNSTDPVALPYHLVPMRLGKLSFLSDKAVLHKVWWSLHVEATELFAGNGTATAQTLCLCWPYFVDSTACNMLILQR